MANLRGMIASRMGLADSIGDVVSPLSRRPNPSPPASASKMTSPVKQSNATEAPKGGKTVEVEEKEGNEESQEVLEATPKDEVEEPEVPTKTVGRGRGRGRGGGRVGGRGRGLKRPAASSSAPSPSTFKRPAAASAPAPAAEVVENEEGGSGANGVVDSGKSTPIGTLLATYGNWQA